MSDAALIGQSVLLGLAAAFTPSLVALQILVCSGDPWRRRALAVAVGGTSAFVLVGGLLLFGFAQLPTGSAHDSAFGSLVRLAAGAVLLMAAVWLFVPHPRIQQRVEQDIRGHVAHASPWVFLGVAFGLSIKDISSFVMMAPALHDIAVSGTDVILQVVLVLVVFALALSPVLAPPLARLVLGHRSDAVFARTYRFTMDHQFQLVGAVALAIGIFLVVTGVLDLR
jgi:Sap, sulfolipid-1-addressing protein